MMLEKTDMEVNERYFIFGQELHTNNLFTIFSIKNTKYT